MGLTIASGVEELPGVGTTRARALARLGLLTAGDLLRYYPRDYEDRRRRATIREAPADSPACVTAIVAEPPRLSRIRKGLELTKVRAVDHSGAMTVTFFNQSYVKNALRTGESYVFFGRVEGPPGRRQMTNPVFESERRARFTGRMMPVYPLTAGISNHLLASLMLRCVEECAAQVDDPLPPEIRQAYNLPPAGECIRRIHFPPDPQSMLLARRRFIFEELFQLSCGLSLLRGRRNTAHGRAFRPCPPEDFARLLPFSLTGAQSRAMEDAARDMASGTPMNRLIQGDVGSGKTMVAAFGAWLAAQNHCQTALMAPTELLAEQHYRSLAPLLAPAGIRTALRTGSVKGAARKAQDGQLQAGEIDLVIGTHALISPDTSYRQLGLVITDEQHRFGVEQRSALAAKADIPPHVLVMSATPIPRTLALLIYGDLDVSVIDQLPPGRSPVQTFVVGEDKRTRMYNFVRRQVAEGRQVYMVCPMVEEGEPDGAGLKSAVLYARQLQEQVFPDLQVGLVHGKLNPRDKEAVMTAFATGSLDVLVSTTVIEVGVDVPNASLMVVENAERFGLSQLHQLRGRVGRGTHQSYCVLVAGNRNPESLTRLRTLASTTDGFRIAEADLKLRGPGDFFGARQHGLPQLRIADLAGDLEVLSQAKEAAEGLLAADPGLEQPEHRALLAQVQRLFSDHPDIFN